MSNFVTLLTTLCPLWKDVGRKFDKKNPLISSKEVWYDVTSIKEARYASKMNFGEQFGSLVAFDMAIDDKSNKSKSVAFKENVEEDADQVEGIHMKT